MKSVRPAFCSYAAIVITAFWSSSLLSQTTVWQGDQINGGEFRWAESANWDAGTPNSGGLNAEFRTIGLGNSTTVTVSSGGDNAISLNFAGGANNASAYTFNLSGNVGAGERLGLSGDITNASSNTQTFNGNIPIEFTSGARAINNSGTGSLVFNTAVSNPGRALTVSNTNNSAPVVFNNTVTAASITKNGTGAVVFNSGASSGISVNAGRMEGTGTIGGATTIGSGASYSAGQTGVANGVGIQSVNNLAFNSNSQFVWQINGEGNVAGTNFDRVSGLTSLSINNNATSVLDISGISNSFWNVNRSWNVFVGTFANPGSVFGSISLTGASAPLPALGSFAWESSANNVRLSFITAVPEPSSMALLGMAGLIGGVYARRRSKKNKA